MLIVANWKAYADTLEKAKRLYAAGKRLGATGRHDIVLAPPSPYLALLAAANRSKVSFAAQDLSATPGGAETGEVTAAMLANLKVKYAIVGHSERRALGENDAAIAAKAHNALLAGIIPIICIGERQRDPEAQYLSFLRSQLAAVLTPLSEKERRQVIIAYEPIWAIGKHAGDSITPADLTEMVLYLRKVLAEYLPGKGSAKLSILYGGSVEPANIRPLADTGVDGFLVGHASAQAPAFGALVKALP